MDGSVVKRKRKLVDDSSKTEDNSFTNRITDEVATVIPSDQSPTSSLVANGSHLNNGINSEIPQKSLSSKDEDNLAVSDNKVGEEDDSSILLSKRPKLSLNWRKIRAENLDCDYCVLYSKSEADLLLSKCEAELSYNTGRTAQVHVYGRWIDIPRKQVAHGDPGLSYSFSKTTVPARPWTPLLNDIRNFVQNATGYRFNFVLINRYNDGNDHIGEHRDDENDLVKESPIASLSLGQPRDFVFRHRDARGKNARRKIAPKEIELQNGSLLMMKYPTNTFWYHSLPKRKNALGTRINMTFRDMVIKS